MLVPNTLGDLERPDVRNQIFVFRRISITLDTGQPRHCICTNASRGLSVTAEFLVIPNTHNSLSSSDDAFTLRLE